jgi:NADH-quinone oxidoreductase subunit F
LRGRGGGGFPTGRKWEAARTQNSPKKYVICNGDEGDPGAFMDRSVMEGDPHSVIEGLMIAARAIGADKAYVYVRAEYPLAVKRMRLAVRDAEARGILGENVFASGQRIRCEVMEGAGAFVCGEETAMIASIDGLRGMPAPKPPFPAQSGLRGKPTIINNVETLAQVPRILLKGAEAYRALGTPTSPGTKTFALTGHVVNTGLIEVPFGTPLREIVFNIGGGVVDDNGKISKKGFKAVQIGGPSGGCLTPDHLDLSLDFDSLKTVGAMIGSGGLVVMNQRTCMVSVARFFMQFTQRESCGKCVLCREGTMQLLALLDDVIEGRGTPETLPLLENLARAVQLGSLCGLGKTAPNPVLSTLRYFRQEYEDHVIHKRCATGQCKALLRPEINQQKCKGCGLCIPACAVGAITGEKKQPHSINQDLCIKCAACAKACNLGAVEGI